MRRLAMPPAMGQLYRNTLIGLFGLCTALAANAAAPPQPGFKLGTFDAQGRVFVGVVLRDTVVVDLAAAHAAIRAPASSVTAPADMKDLIARYDLGLRERILQIVGLVNSTPATQRLPYVYHFSFCVFLPQVLIKISSLIEFFYNIL